MKQSQFDTKEAEGRARFESLTAQVQQWTINKFSNLDKNLPWDVSVYSASTPVIIEIKVREISLDKYPNAFIEEHKILEINKLCKEIPGAVGYYVAFYPKSNKVALWPLNDWKYKEPAYCPSKTMGTHITKSKMMCYYPISEATIYSI